MLARTAQGDTCRAAVGIASASYFHTCIYYAYSYMGAHIFFGEGGATGEAGCVRRGWVHPERLGALGAGCGWVAYRL